jgi:maltooligosyltrehalose trehalohydrolase
MVLYELHVGTFTPGGTFDSAVAELPRLRELGVTALEVMPVAQFPGRRNWGYDGVYPFAVQDSYGGPEGLKRFVDAAHAHGLAVLLDVVYNHLGPEGCYFRDFGPYFTRSYRTPWGEPFNLDGPGSDAVRHYLLQNALWWQEELHLDGLRLDAVPFIKDASPEHFLAELARVTHANAERLGRPFTLIGESDLNDPRLVRPASVGGWGLDAAWSDDFHHSLHAYLTGERSGFYADHGALEDVAATLRDGYRLTGQYSRYRERRHGAPAPDVPGERFVLYTQNHDLVGNRPGSARLSAQLSPRLLKVLAGLTLLTPYTPMLFMGEEYGELAPFPYFIDHGCPLLSEKVRKGRHAEYAASLGRSELPDPASLETYLSARLDTSRALHGAGRELHDWYRGLLRLRRECPVLSGSGREGLDARALEEEGALVARRRSHAGEVLLTACLSQQPHTVTLDRASGAWSLTLASDSSVTWTCGPDGLRADLPGQSFTVWSRITRASPTSQAASSIGS